MADDKNDGGYEVGYGRPPKHTQFPKGRSGNPGGRPKGSLNVATVLARTLRERVTVTENGRHKTTTKLQAAINQLVSQAASGDVAALRLLMNLTASAEQSAREASATVSSSNLADQKVIAEIAKRFEQSKKGE